MTPTSARLALALATLALAACGQKGPLYLPDSTQGEVITRPTQTPAEAPAPAPEVTAPEATDPADKDKKNGATPPK